MTQTKRPQETKDRDAVVLDAIVQSLELSKGEQVKVIMNPNALTSVDALEEVLGREIPSEKRSEVKKNMGDTSPERGSIEESVEITKILEPIRGKLGDLGLLLDKQVEPSPDEVGERAPFGAVEDFSLGIKNKLTFFNILDKSSESGDN